MPPQQRQQLSQVSLDAGPQGGGGNAGNALIQSIAQQMAQQTQESIAALQKLAMQSQQNAAAERQSAVAGLTETLNQFAAGQQRIQQQENAREERAVDRQFQEDTMKLNHELAQEMQREATRVSQQIKSQREATNRYLDKFESDRLEAEASISQGREQLQQLQEAGYFDQFDDGIDRYLKIRNSLNHAEAMADNHFSDDNIAQAMGALNKTTNDIIRGLPANDLSHLQVDPFLVPNPELKRPGRPTPNMSSEQLFEHKLTNGYPPQGVFFGENVYDDEGNTETEVPFMDVDTFREVLFYDSMLTQMTDDRTRRQTLDMMNRTVVEANDKLGQMTGIYKDTNKVMLSSAPDAVDRGLRQFTMVAGQDPRVFQDVPRNLVAMTIQNIFPKNGAEVAQLALDIFDGKKKLETAQDFYVAMALESATFNIAQFIDDGINTKVSAGPDGKTPQGMATDMVDQLVAQVGEENALRSLGLSDSLDLKEGGTGIVLASQAMQRRLVAAKGFAERMSEGFRRSSALVEYKKQLGKNLRLGDILTMHKFMTDQQDAEAMEALLNSAVESAEGLSTEQLSQIQQTPELRQSVNLMDAMIATGEHIGPNALNSIANMVVGGANEKNLISPNFPGYKEGRKRGIGNGTMTDRMGRYVHHELQKQVAKRKQAEKEAELQKTREKEKTEGGVIGRAAGDIGRGVEKLPAETAGAAETALDLTEELAKFLYGEKNLDFLAGSLVATGVEDASRRRGQQPNVSGEGILPEGREGN